MSIKKEEILNLFYNEHMKVNEISVKIQISSPYVSKIIKNDSRYIKEKADRKQNSISNRKLAQNKFIKEKRTKQKENDNYDIVLLQHRQASIELSKGTILCDESYRKCNSSAYTYNKEKNRYEFIEKFGRAADVPKYVKGKL